MRYFVALLLFLGAQSNLRIVVIEGEGAYLAQALEIIHSC